MNFFDVVALLGGLAMFLYGMKLMSHTLEEDSSGALKKFMGKITNNAFKAFLLGVVVTAVIQSSTATIVLTSGLVAAGILSLRQSLGIIIGANVGTTVTGQIIRLLDVNAGSTSILRLFQPSTLAPLALIIGIVLIMFIKRGNSKSTGTVLMGFGILFVGLMNMSSAVEGMGDLLSQCENTGRSKLCFVIGGSFGLAECIKNKSDSKLSMSKMTFPHHLARVMLAEQLYRGYKIREGSRYHK